jgi:3-polyprenyl-4-hydroxybenzoate decarboxylase
MSANDKPVIVYDDLREWLAEAERLGEVRTVRDASWQEDIGLVAEAILRAENGPCVVFEDIQDCPKGYRLLLNMFAGRRRHVLRTVRCVALRCVALRCAGTTTSCAASSSRIPVASRC